MIDFKSFYEKTFWMGFLAGITTGTIAMTLIYIFLLVYAR
jgi:hypothetical protein